MTTKKTDYASEMNAALGLFKQASVKADVMLNDLDGDVLLMCKKLQDSGYAKEASELESKFRMFKKAETDVLSGKALIDKAHPKSVKVPGVPAAEVMSVVEMKREILQAAKMKDKTAGARNEYLAVAHPKGTKVPGLDVVVPTVEDAKEEILRALGLKKKASGSLIREAQDAPTQAEWETNKAAREAAKHSSSVQDDGSYGTGVSTVATNIVSKMPSTTGGWVAGLQNLVHDGRGVQYAFTYFISTGVVQKLLATKDYGRSERSQSAFNTLVQFMHGISTTWNVNTLIDEATQLPNHRVMPGADEIKSSLNPAYSIAQKIIIASQGGTQALCEFNTDGPVRLIINGQYQPLDYKATSAIQSVEAKKSPTATSSTLSYSKPITQTTAGTQFTIKVSTDGGSYVVVNSNGTTSNVCDFKDSLFDPNNGVEMGSVDKDANGYFRWKDTDGMYFWNNLTGEYIGFVEKK
jgi:hypothetical protein